MKQNICVPALAAGMLLLVQFSCKNKPAETVKPDQYIVTQPLLSSTGYQQEYVADIQSQQNVEIRSRAKGFIERVHVDEGAFVTQGQLLFTLNSKEYRDELSKSNAALKQAEAELKQIEIEIRNVELLISKNVVSKAELTSLQAKKDAMLAIIDQSKAAISQATTGLSYTQIRAPFSGYINRIPKKAGALVEEADLLTSLSNNQQVFAYFNVSEVDYLQYIKEPELYKTVELKLADGSLFAHKGSIETIDGEINSETGTIAFRARFPNPNKILKHGASGKIILNKPLNNALLIPVKSTYEVQENLYVFVVDKNGKVTQRKVDPIVRLTNEYAIKGGLTASDYILYEGVQLVKDGDQVQTVLKPMNDLLNTQNR
ncbi:membrane fusion protein (multidrug efflux system) [Lacibacter cauensis]|uniref:Membrane fusion protein (Multidrug efflux system) n=1 Tax=Lacibacter cauensis TaxID=510947 RepID=A0A562SCB2_9BACT|nr:efflux RND transporter periplasmic adaptor subunit [Lacibacter cauensis]TWI79002.1 membrane fusion protein (multidrug efflux system) [Lacibacter cauensis]